MHGRNLHLHQLDTNLGYMQTTLEPNIANLRINLNLGLTC